MNKSNRYITSKHFFTALFLLFSCFGLSAQNLVPNSVERDVLLSLYTTTNGEDWVESKRWTLSQINSYPDSALYGVTIENGDISFINLDNAGLSGTLPSELNDLTELVNLSIRGNLNSLGVLPNLSPLTKLKTLDFSNTDLSGNFPTWIGDLVSLETLNLTSNPNTAIKMTGPVTSEIGKLSNLKYLYLNYNDLSATGSIPDSLSYLDNLLGLELQNCQLVPAAVGSGLSGLASLQSMNLNGNPAFIMPDATFPDVLFNLPNLRTLTLRSVDLQRLPDRFDELPLLNFLDLSSNNFSDTTRLKQVVDTLKNCPSVKILLLTQCSISALPSNVDDLATLEDLYLSNNPIQPSACEVLGEMIALRNLFLYSCNLTDLPQTLVNVETLDGLYLSNNNLSNVPTTIRDIPNLQVLYLANNNIQTLPSWFGAGSMGTLHTLLLDNNSLQSLPENFSGLTDLTYLSISNNQLNGQWPANFSDLNKIETLYLPNNNINELPDLTGWTTLKYIQLQNNELSASVPAYLTNVTSLKNHVDISGNDYTGVDVSSHFSGSNVTLLVQNNHFTFADILPLKPASGSYTYSPQPDTVDQEKEVQAFFGGQLTLVAAIDTTTIPASRFQWFRYVNGTNDIALNTTPIESAYKYTINITQADVGSKYYYKITNTNASALTLVSHLQTLVITCDVLPTSVDFIAKRFLCAMNFIPQVSYEAGCRTKSFSWEFGDGDSSIDKTPFHAFEAGGTYNVTMSIQYSCGICVRDTVITKQITYNVAEDVLMDSLVAVSTNIKSQVLSASASTFSDSWPLQHSSNTESGNSFTNGSEGVWRNDGAYVYNVPRHQSGSAKIATDGAFSLDHFNWHYAEINAIPNWIKSNAMTAYSPFSYELENRDVLGIYSAALYDYGGHLPSANGVNMRNREMAFTSFEFFGQKFKGEFLNKKSSGNWIFGTQQLPTYYLYEVYSGYQNIAIVKASLEELENVLKVDVSSKGAFFINFTGQVNYNYIIDDDIVCKQVYPNNPEWSMIVLRRSPFIGIWNGSIKVKNQITPIISPDVDSTFAHAGISSLKITAEKTFKQNLLQLDSGKSYMISGWVSVKNPYVTTPTLAEALGFELVFKDKNGNTLLTSAFEPSGRIIEGWQQVKGTFVCPDKRVVVEIKFKPGSTGTAWYDDLRLFPERGNMKSYVYDLKDYRLRAILDEENFASFFYYDQEGNLYLTKKETETGIKTISENISYTVERE